LFVRTQTNGSRTYLLIVDNKWVGGKVKQHVLLRLGRLDELLASGQLDSLIQSLGRFSEKLAVLGAHARGDSITTRSARIGPALIFQRLWQTCSIDKVLSALLEDRRFEFSVERAIFLTVLHRLFAPGSDRAAEKWKDDYAIQGTGDLGLHQLYRAMAWLGEVLPKDQQDGATPFAPRTNKDLIEEALFARHRDLFSDLDIVFFDTTSIYFEGEGGETIGQRGHSKDHRPDLKQMVVGMVLDQNGNPLCTELWPGNTADVKSLVPIVERLKKRFGIGSVSIVADRGMISAATLAEVEKREWKYILGVRMRSQGGGGARWPLCGSASQKRRPGRSLAAEGERSLGRGCAAVCGVRERGSSHEGPPRPRSRGGLATRRVGQWRQVTGGQQRVSQIPARGRQTVRR
jgi:hypothetical protein